MHNYYLFYLLFLCITANAQHTQQVKFINRVQVDVRNSPLHYSVGLGYDKALNQRIALRGTYNLGFLNSKKAHNHDIALGVNYFFKKTFDGIYIFPNLLYAVSKRQNTYPNKYEYNKYWGVGLGLGYSFSFRKRLLITPEIEGNLVSNSILSKPFNLRILGAIQFGYLF